MSLATVKENNANYLDLYGTIFDDYVQLPGDATLEDIRQVVDSTNKIMTHNIKVGDRCVVAGRKFTYQGRYVIKTDFLHIYVVDSFERKNILTHWREQANGNFKTV